MPRRHSSMGVHNPTHNMTITNAWVNRTNLHQNEALQQEFQDFINKYVSTQYVDNYNVNDTTLEAYDTQYGQFIENKLQEFAGYNLNSEQRRDNTWFQNNATAYFNLVKNARQGFIIQQANEQQHAEIQTTIHAAYINTNYNIQATEYKIHNAYKWFHCAPPWVHMSWNFVKMKLWPWWRFYHMRRLPMIA